MSRQSNKQPSSMAISDNNNNNNGGMLSGKILVRIMILLGLASIVMNVRYYQQSHLSDSELETEVPDSVDAGGRWDNNVVLLETSEHSNINNNMASNNIGSDRAASTTSNAKNKKGGAKKEKKTVDGEFVNGQLVKRDKQGRIIVKAVTALDKSDLVGVDDDATPKNADLTLEEASIGREPLITMLQEAGIQDFDAETVAKLPTTSQIEKLYGKGPIVYGLDTCQAFRDMIPASEASVASAGIFNSGTNTLAMYMNANCVMPENKKEKYGGMRWQVPWGKHMVAKRRLTNTVKNDRKVNKTTVMPVIAIRDPYSWMQSMCRHPYAAKWHHSPKHCPNLVPNQDDLDLFPYLEDTIPVTIKYPEKAENWDSLAHVWSDWYGQYFNADYPRLIVRFEDLLFNVKEMANTVCECVGGVPRNEQFAYVVDSGKFGKGHPEHGAKHTNLISAMVKYGSDKKRFTGMTDEDLTLAYEALDAEMMAAFQYEVPPPPS